LTVHPVPGPTSTKAELKRSKSDGGNNQKLILFKRGNAINYIPVGVCLHIKLISIRRPPADGEKETLGAPAAEKQGAQSLA
jgi:hypothetical protein